MRQYTAIYDACVLYPSALRSFLMYLAMTGLFRARWTRDIHEEWMRHVGENRPDITRDTLERIRDLMDQHVEGCLVSGYDALIPALTLPDPDDRHVLAAAIVGDADAIVTFNLKDFPDTALNPYGVQAIHPDDFIVYQLDLHQGQVCQAAKRHRASLRRPPRTVEEYLASLSQQQLPRTVERLREFAELI